MQKEGITLFIFKHSAGAAALSEWLHGKAVGGGIQAQLSTFPYGALSVCPSILTQWTGEGGMLETILQCCCPEMCTNGFNEGAPKEGNGLPRA